MRYVICYMYKRFYRGLLCFCGKRRLVRDGRFCRPSRDLRLNNGAEFCGWTMELSFAVEQWSWVLRLNNGVEFCGLTMELSFAVEQWSWFLLLNNGVEFCGWTMRMKYANEICGCKMLLSFAVKLCGWFFAFDFCVYGFEVDPLRFIREYIFLEWRLCGRRTSHCRLRFRPFRSGWIPAGVFRSRLNTDWRTAASSARS